MSSPYDRFLSLTSPLMPYPWWSKLVAWVSQEMAQDSAHDWEHLCRVWHNARAIFAEESFEPKIAWHPIGVAVVCHDVVNVPKDRREDRAKASTWSAKKSVGWLREQTELGEGELGLVEEAIRTHSFSSGFMPESLSAKIMTDADRLDALGALGVVRVVQVGQALGRPFYDPEDPLAVERQADDGAWGVDHFFEKILKLPMMMHTKSGRRLAVERGRFVCSFLEQLASEVGYESGSLAVWEQRWCAGEPMKKKG